MDVSMEVVKTPRFILKAVQLVVAITCTVLNDPGLASRGHIYKFILIYVVLCGYMLILLMDMSKIVSGGKTAKQVEIFWSFISGILWITAGALILEVYIFHKEPTNAPDQLDLPRLKKILDPTRMKKLMEAIASTVLGIEPAVLNKFLAAGILSLLNGLAFFAEATVTFQSGSVTRKN
ncbi:uncharacterized protein LOC124166083 [Ischnura elegans]|uniref:uncharacterized protein LOC124166083 n=1 Tax=Ischnura elegans TaxID=197161 RepID=UPI001ED88458|nr:uncharacterized protein LOC124166083 [Ischnura elegans]